MNLIDYLNTAQKSLFRFEYLQDFSAADEKSFTRWRKTKQIDTAALQPWWDFLERKHADGVVTSRVRRVAIPLSEYTRFELEGHRETAKHGDDIRIIKNDQFKTLAIPLVDFWLIDDAAVIRMVYGERGTLLGIEKEDAKNEHLEAKRKLIANSISISSFASA